LKALFDEKEFLSPGGIRGISKLHETPYNVNINGMDFGLNYEPAEGTTNLFGGNSNWRGPVWMPMNYMLVLALQQYHAYYKESIRVAFPTGSGNEMNLHSISNEIAGRLVSIFTQDEHSKRPVNGVESIYQQDPHFKDLILFYEYFDGDNARGVGASHQTGWTGVVAELINRINPPNQKNRQKIISELAVTS
jgi:hypothetical protein